MRNIDAEIHELSKNYYRIGDSGYARYVFTRPVINYKKAWIKTALSVAAVTALSLLLLGPMRGLLSVGSGAAFLLLFLSFGILLLVVFSRKILIWFLLVYQARAKIETRLRCCSEPSCSDYAILAVKKYGAVRGAYKAYRRYANCHPPGKIDYP